MYSTIVFVIFRFQELVDDYWIFFSCYWTIEVRRF